MQAKFLTTALIAVAGFAAAPSFAGQYLGGEVGFFAPDTPVTSTLTREQVRNEVIQAARDGTLPATGEAPDLGQAVAARATTSDVTRAQVRAETVYAVQHGLRIGGEV